MNKLIVAAFAALAINCTSVQADTLSDLQVQIAALQAQLVALQGETPTTTAESIADGGVNPINVARAFALKTPASYQGYLNGNALIDGAFRWTEMSFTMNSDFEITSLVIDQTNNIPIDEPLKGLPMCNGGLMRGVYLGINAMTADGEYAGNGYTNKNVVSRGDNLMVVLSPADIRMEVPVDAEYINQNVRLTIDGLSNYGWGWSNGKLYVYLSPVGGTYSYTVSLPDGTTIGSGQLEPFHNTVTDNDSYVGISYIGNVIGMQFPQPDGYESWTYINAIDMNCSIPMSDGSITNGKVVFADVGSGGLEVVIWGDYQVIVQSATDVNGDMPSLALQDNSSSGPGWHETRVNTVNMNVGRVVITIIPRSGNSVLKPYLELGRFYGTPNGGGYG